MTDESKNNGEMLLDQAVAMLRQAEPQLPHGDYGIAVDIRLWLEANFPDVTAKAGGT